MGDPIGQNDSFSVYMYYATSINQNMNLFEKKCDKRVAFKFYQNNGVSDLNRTFLQIAN